MAKGNVHVMGAVLRTGTSQIRTIAIVLAFVVVVTGGLGIAVGGLTLTAERIVGLALLPLMVLHLLGSLGPRGPRRLLWMWSAWLAILIVSAVFSGDLIAHSVAFITAAIPVAYFSLLVIGPLDGRLIDRIARTLLWLQLVPGIPIIIWRQSLGPSPLVSPFVDALGRIKLLVFEPNLLGSIICFLILITLPRARWSIGNIILYSLSLAVLLGTLSKMPIIALAFSLMLYGLLRAIALGRGGTIAVTLPLWIGGVAVTAAIAVLPMIQDIYIRLLDRTDSVTSRLYLYRLAVQRFLESPIIGRGPGDFGLQDLSIIKQIGAYDRENLWIGQMMLSILHDSGIIGLLIYLIFLLALFVHAGRWIGAGSLDHAGYASAFASILIASQATTSHLLPLFGIAAGLVGSVPFLMVGRQRTTPFSVPAVPPV